MDAQSYVDAAMRCLGLSNREDRGASRAHHGIQGDSGGPRFRSRSSGSSSSSGSEGALGEEELRACLAMLQLRQEELSQGAGAGAAVSDDTHTLALLHRLQPHLLCIGSHQR